MDLFGIDQFFTGWMQEGIPYTVCHDVSDIVYFASLDMDF
jgi:hypothetical protein